MWYLWIDFCILKVENPVFVLKIKHVPSVYGCRDKQFCGDGNNI